MGIDINELKQRAFQFANRWSDAENERAEAQSFWNEFFGVFGFDRKKLAEFEKSVKKFSGTTGKIDLFWPGKLIVEHKSKNENLEKAFGQLKNYWFDLNQSDRPRYLIVSDFNRIYCYDDHTKDSFEILLSAFSDNIDKFSFIYSDHKPLWQDEEQVNIRATKLMGELHDAIHENGYTGHELEKLLMRILFCLFAEDTDIYSPKGLFTSFITEHTREDGSDVGSQLNVLFEVLNKPLKERQKSLPEVFHEFPYVNGELYSEHLPVAHFNKKQKEILLKCCSFNWNEISPIIFGSMFQFVMDKEKRSNLGAHYTSEKNILKVIDDLFLNDLKQEFEKVKGSRKKLNDFHKSLEELKFLDPACGCGNFLIIAYRELRLLEIEIFKQLQIINKKEGQTSLKILESFIHLDSFYGIEYEEFPAQIAETAMWLMEHKMNQIIIRDLGGDVDTLPLKKSARIFKGNALRMEWNALSPQVEISYIFGNPPFVSKKKRSKEQQDDMQFVFGEDSTVLDYVCAWYMKAAKLISGTNKKAAFVSTNSITQGEHPSALWPFLFQYNMSIDFAHRTFKWKNEAKGKRAGVYVVIIGFSDSSDSKKVIYEYETPISDPEANAAKHINPYLIDFEDLLLPKRKGPLDSVPEIIFGSMPNDGGNLLLSEEEKVEFIKIEPGAKKFIKPLISADEFINGYKRWCIWLKDTDPSEWRSLKEVVKRVDLVKKHRGKSKRAATAKLASTAYLFGEIRQPTANYLLIPRHSSENRRYIPMAFLPKTSIVSDSCLFVPNASSYHFGILTSTMHMAWMRQVCGRLESRYRYSNELVYNNYPWPLGISKENAAKISNKAEEIIKVRELFDSSSLADLYDPLTMPKELRKAHEELDKLVDKSYRPQAFNSEKQRLEYLFGLYRDRTANLFTDEEKSKKPKRKKNI